MKKLLPLMLLLLAGCKTSNVVLDDKAELISTKESVINKLGCWYEPTLTGVGRRFVMGFAQSEMQKDSTYRMRTTDGWMMSIKYNQITWAL